ncbi:hypothetical protein AQUCO_01900193v1 [Aquilegia coerulea]|uniref:Uncharacterized protein n=1 Tax=Aquilegia coerulea TaxID=218851 RepID=A0A2G5DJE0_AQUCA|nr:hypothetical protein AQUCO_01900193v1 [Aquilegia coerulea]
MFWSKPCSLALPPDSPLAVEDPNYEGIKHIIFKLLQFYSKQSKSIRGANIVYGRVISQVEKPAIYDVMKNKFTLHHITVFKLWRSFTYWGFYHSISTRAQTLLAQSPPTSSSIITALSVC